MRRPACLGRACCRGCHFDYKKKRCNYSANVHHNRCRNRSHRTLLAVASVVGDGGVASHLLIGPSVQIEVVSSTEHRRIDGAKLAKSIAAQLLLLLYYFAIAALFRSLSPLSLPYNCNSSITFEVEEQASTLI